VADNKEFYRLDLVIGTDGVEGTEKKIKLLDKLLEQTERRAAALGKVKISPSVRLEDRASERVRAVTTAVSRLDRAKAEPRANLLDRVSGPAQKISKTLGDLSRKPFDIVIRAKDMATGVIGKVTGALTSPLAMLGVSGGVAGVTTVGLQMVMDEQSITSAFKVLLGSAEKAQQRVEELIKFAGQTPYTRMEIFKSSRILEVFTKGKLSTGDGLKMVGDIASGTQTDFENVALWIGRLYDGMASGQKVGESTSRLQEMGAIDGKQRDRLEALAEGPGKIADKWKQAEKEFQRFDGMMEDMSGNLANLLLGTKSFFSQNIIKRWGQGVESVIGPLLKRFRQWRSENKDTIVKMAQQAQDYGAKMTNFVVGGLENVITKVRDVAKTDTFKNADLFGKSKILWDEFITQPLDEWWAAGGQQKIQDMSSRIGTALGGGLKGFILGALGLFDGKESSDESVYVSAGKIAGKAFFDSFVEAFEPSKILEKLQSTVWNVGEKAVKDPTAGNLTSAGLLGLALWNLGGGKLLKTGGKLLKGGYQASKGLYKGGKWLAGKGKVPAPSIPSPNLTPTSSPPVTAPSSTTIKPTAKLPGPYEPGWRPRYQTPVKPNAPLPKTPMPGIPTLGKTIMLSNYATIPMLLGQIISDRLEAAKTDRSNEWQNRFKDNPAMLQWGAQPVYERMNVNNNAAATTPNSFMFGTDKTTPKVELSDDQISSLTGYLDKVKFENTNDITVNVPSGAVQVTVKKDEIDWSSISSFITSRIVTGLKQSYENQ